MKPSNSKPPQPNSNHVFEDLITLKKHPLAVIAAAMTFGMLIGYILRPVPAPSSPTPPETNSSNLLSNLKTGSLIRGGLGAIGGMIVVVAFQQIKKHFQTGYGKRHRVGKDKLAIVYNKEGEVMRFLSETKPHYHPMKGEFVKLIPRSQENQNITYTCMSADRIPLLIQVSASTSINTKNDDYIKKNKAPHEVVASEVKHIVTREIGRRDQQAASGHLQEISKILASELPGKINPYGLKLNTIRIETIAVDRRNMTNAALLAEGIQTLDPKVRQADQRTIDLLNNRQGLL